MPSVHGGRPAGAISRVPDRLDLGVRPPGTFVVPLADDFSSGDDHRPDERIRKGLPQGVLGELERAANVLLLIIHESLLRERIVSSGFT
jgi:hypothetical protein